MRMYDKEQLFKRMVMIRRFEEKVSRLYAASKIPGFVHLYMGEEAVAVGVCSNLTDKDYITSTHRGHGHLIAKGGNINYMMAELFGKRTGYCKGKGGSMHIADLDLGILGANGIVGGGLPIAVGAGYSSKIQGSDHVAVAFFGDGATNEGTFHEAMNIASAFKLPVVFICEYNKFGVSTRIDRITGEPDVSKRSAGYGMPGYFIDGNDVLEVKRVSQEAIERARNDQGPSLIVCDTFRYHGHFEGETVNYWSKQELAQWKEKDPIQVYRTYLTDHEKLDEAALKSIEDQVEQELKAAVEFAEESAFPEASEALEDLFWTK